MKSFFAALILSIFTISLAQADSVTVGIENLDYYPYYSSSGGNNTGAAIALFEKFSKDSEHEIKFKALPVARLLPTFLTNNIRYKFPANPNWAKGAKVGIDIVYSEPVFKFTDGVLVKAENKGKGIKKLGVVRGFTAWDFLDKIESGEVKVTEGSNLESMVKMLDLNRIDGLYCNINVAKYIVKKVLSNSDGIIFDDSLPHTTSNYHLASRGSTKLIEDFNAFLIKEKSFIQDVKKQHGIF
jgi:hypothetical protein